MTERLVLCRPQGGFNDMFSQIEVCRRYAEQHNRTVIVDTAYEGSSTFHDDLGRYFESRDPRLVLGLDRQRYPVGTMTIVPAWLAGRVDTYRAELRQDAYLSTVFGRSVRSWQETETGQIVTFDLKRDYDEQLLVHHEKGGHKFSAFALARMRLLPALGEELKRRLDAIGGAYSAIHVRHTDYRSQYGDALNKLRAAPPERLFVATDNAAVLAEFREALGAERVFSFAQLPGGGKPLHVERLDPQATFERNRDTILDLLMLALAGEFTMVRLDGPMIVSGYTNLAKTLFQSSHAVREIVGRDDIKYDRKSS